MGCQGRHVGDMRTTARSGGWRLNKAGYGALRRASGADRQAVKSIINELAMKEDI